MVNVLLAVASGALTSLAFAPLEFWPIVFVSLVPLLVALRRSATVRAAALVALAFWYTLLALALHWMVSIFGSAVISVYVILALPGVLFGVAYALVRGRGNAWLLMAATPVLWVGVELVRCELWYFSFSWLQLGSVLSPWPASGFVYRAVGVYGVTFIAVLVNALFVEAGAQKRPVRCLAGVVGTLIVAVLGLSTLRTPAAPPDAMAVTACLIQDESGGIDRLEEYSLSTITSEPELLVWPEGSIPGYPLSEPELMAHLGGIARQTGATLVLGAKEHAPDDAACDWLQRHAMLSTKGHLFYNTAFIIGPDGELVGRYHKRHPIQFFADGVPGEGYPVFDTAVGALGIAVCYDFDFAPTALNLVRNGAEVLAVPTYDLLDWGPVQHLQHARMAKARAAEVGRWTVRTTSSGISQIISPYGEVIARMGSGESAVRIGQIRALRERTPYVRWLYVLPRACLAIGLALLAGLAWAGRGRRERSGAGSGDVPS